MATKLIDRAAPRQQQPDPIPSHDPWRDIAWVAEQTGMSREWVRAHMRAGRLPPHFKFGRAAKWRQSVILAWIASCQETAHAS